MASSGSIMLEMNQNAAYNKFLEILRASGAEPTFQMPPGRVEFTSQKSEGGMKVVCEGEATVTQVQDRTSVALEVHASKNTVMYVVVLELVVFLVLWFLLGIIGIIASVVVGLWMFWSYIMDFPEQTFKKIRTAAMQVPSVPAIAQEARQPAPSPASSAENTKFCISCGKKIPPEASFCQYCGVKQP